MSATLAASFFVCVYVLHTTVSLKQAMIPGYLSVCFLLSFILLSDGTAVSTKNRLRFIPDFVTEIRAIMMHAYRGFSVGIASL